MLWSFSHADKSTMKLKISPTKSNKSYTVYICTPGAERCSETSFGQFEKCQFMTISGQLNHTIILNAIWSKITIQSCQGPAQMQLSPCALDPPKYIHAIPNTLTYVILIHSRVACVVLLPSQRSCEGYVFTGLCLSASGRGVCSLGCLLRGGGCLLLGGVCSRGVCSRGVSALH